MLASAACPLATFAQGTNPCDAVLAGDLINKVIRSNTSHSASRFALREYLFSQTEDEAYSLYNKEVDTAKKQGQAGAVGGSYFGISGNADFQLSYENRISRKDFGEKFRAAKKIFNTSRGSEGASSTSLASSYASHVRDANSIDAWKACVTQQPSPGLHAFGSRDDSGSPSISVVWAPGPLAGVAPAIKVEVITLSAGVKVQPSVADVAVGSGRAFRIVAQDTQKGFAVRVNGDLKARDGATLGSFSALASIPPVQHAKVEATRPCVGFVAANKLYELQVTTFNPKKNEEVSMPMILSVGSRVESAYPGTVAFTGLFGAPGIPASPMYVLIVGDRISLAEKEDSHPTLRGECYADHARVSGPSIFSRGSVLVAK
jgi:hypothetical protein